MASKSPTPESSPNSPLSSIASEDLSDPEDNSRNYSRDETQSLLDEASPSASNSTPRAMPPAKRRRTAAYDHPTPASVTTYGADDIPQPPRSPATSISSDSSGEVPASPSFAHLAPTHPLSTTSGADDEPGGKDTEQVTICHWTDCTAGDLGNMDVLVSHIHDTHIGPKRQKYSCEWESCNRKGMPHASGYALRAHMRSHTREKPFYCALPECDRSFTRSDALAKHMRTVHETEALRPSDPVPRGHSGGVGGWPSTSTPTTTSTPAATNGGPKKLKLVMKDKSNSASTPAAKPLKDPSTLLKDPLPPLPQTATGSPIDIDTIPFELPIPPDYYPPDVARELYAEEVSLPPSQLFRLLRRQVHWAEQESGALESELRDLQQGLDEPQRPGESKDLNAPSALPKIKEEPKDKDSSVTTLGNKKNALAPPQQHNLITASDREALEAEFGKENRARREGWRMTEGIVEELVARAATEEEERQRKELEEEREGTRMKEWGQTGGGLVRAGSEM
ncbi:MAG: hypothetical protein Q9227_007023 [Pyrenula ochraceoflavens]